MAVCRFLWVTTGVILRVDFWSIFVKKYPSISSLFMISLPISILYSMSLIARWLISALSFLVIANVVPGIHVQSFVTALILAVVWGVITMILKPILLVLTLPVNILSFGLFTLIINGFLFWVLAGLVPGFTVVNFWTAVLGALALSILHMIVHFAFRERE